MENYLTVLGLFQHTRQPTTQTELLTVDKFKALFQLRKGLSTGLRDA